MKSLPLCVALTLAGCSTIEDPVLPSPATWLPAGEAATVEVVTSIGPAPHAATVRALNAFGAAVPTEPHDLTVGGAPLTVPFDGLGYGRVELESAGSAEIVGGETPGWVHAIETEWPGSGLHPAGIAPVDQPTFAAAVTTGAIAAQEAEVWWMGWGAPPHRVLVADAPLLGLAAVHVDVDGVLDAVAWTSGTVYLLRGRAAGGLAWGAALTAGGHTVGGVDVSDLDEDNLPDLAVAWADGQGTGLLDVHLGDGLFGFEAVEPRHLRDVPAGVSIADNSGVEMPQITVMYLDGTWGRWIQGAPGEFVPIGPLTPESVVLPLGATVTSPGDINRDNADELLVVAPRQPGVNREMYAFDIDGEQISLLPITQEPGAYVAFGDGDGDVLPDIWMHHDTNALFALHFAPTELQPDNYSKQEVLDPTPGHGPIAVGDLDHDGIQDLFLAAPGTWWWYRGWNRPNNTDIFWEPHASDLWQVREGWSGPQALVELDGDPTTFEIVGFTQEDGQTLLKTARFEQGGGRAPQLDATVVSDGGEDPLDLAVCGSWAWALVGGKLAVVDLADPLALRVHATGNTPGTRVDCGSGPSGAEGALLEDGTIELLSRGLDVLSTLDAASAVDLAIGDVGAGAEVQTCDTASCRIAWWPWGSAGEASFAVADPEGTRLLGGSGSLDIGGRGGGDLAVGDIDDDGNLDLVATGGGLMTLHRSTGVAVGPPELLHAPGLTAVVGAADGDGDGFPDLWVSDADGNLKFTQPPRPEPETTGGGAGQTGDTGPAGPTGDTAPPSDTGAP